MTELPGVRAMLRETAQRRYGRQRMYRRVVRRGVPIGVAGVAVASVTALVVLQGPDREIEAVNPSDPSVSSPAPSAVTSNTGVEPLDVTSLRDTEPVREDLGSGDELVRAWRVPELRGNVHLIRDADGWCISVPDPLTDRPDIERGKTCTGATVFAERGISVAMGSTSVSLGPGPDAPLVVRTGEGPPVAPPKKPSGTRG